MTGGAKPNSARVLTCYLGPTLSYLVVGFLVTDSGTLPTVIHSTYLVGGNGDHLPTPLTYGTCPAIQNADLALLYLPTVTWKRGPTQETWTYR